MEDRDFQNQRIVKRRLMEAQCGAEVRRLHIVYILSRKGFNEHPHLIRVHHLSRNGVRLRDIKRWLGELRGKDMPESFSWSYKRRYRTGYVWQDIVDDDLITPISDNEYVLKGSEISSTINDIEFAYSNDKNIPTQKEQSSLQEAEVEAEAESEAVSDEMKSSCKEQNQSPPSVIDESVFGSEKSTLTDDHSRKLDQIHNNLPQINQEKQEQESSSSFHSAVDLNIKKSKRRTKKVTINEKVISSSLDHKFGFRKRESGSNGASNTLKNLMTCGGVDTNDSAVVMRKNQSKPLLNMCSSHQRDVYSANICRREKPQNLFGTPNQWSKSSKSGDGVKDSAKKNGQFREQRATRAAYRPLNRPNCSQCGKPFQPEKLHVHMKSCKGTKASAKAAATSPASSVADNASTHISTESRYDRGSSSVTAYLLAH